MRFQRSAGAALGAALLALTSTTLWAHPGHGQTAADSVAHYALEPLHVGPTLVALSAGVAGVAVWTVWRRATRG